MACLGSGKDRGSILGSGNVRRSFGKLENYFFLFLGSGNWKRGVILKICKRGDGESF